MIGVLFSFIHDQTYLDHSFVFVAERRFMIIISTFKRCFCKSQVIFIGVISVIGNISLVNYLSSGQVFIHIHIYIYIHSLYILYICRYIIYIIYICIIYILHICIYVYIYIIFIYYIYIYIYI